MQELIKPIKYPLELRKVIYKQSSLGVAIANRWMLGWPKRVDALVKSNKYQEAFLMQTELERKTITEMSQEWDHLADHEKMAMMEINPEPPMTE